LSLESEAETRKRIVTVEKGVEAAFKAAIEHLGEEEARRWRMATRGEQPGLLSVSTSEK
jgi:hypothetical protein